MATQKTTGKAPTTADFAAKVASAAAALATIPATLPSVVGFHYWPTGSFRLVLRHERYSLKSVADLVAWAEAFDASVYVSLSSYGSGEVQVEFVLDGVTFSVNKNIGTAEAYQMGAVMGRQLSPDKGLSLTPAEMRSALTLIAGA